MSRVLCDKCGYSFLSDRGEIKKVFDLDVCYKCGNYEPVVEVVDAIAVTDEDEAVTEIEE